MKVLVFDNLQSELKPGRGGVAGGLEKVAKDDAFEMHAEGHEVIFCYAGSGVAAPSLPFRCESLHEYTKEGLFTYKQKTGKGQVGWLNEVTKNLQALLTREDPDIVLYHNHALSPAVSILKSHRVPVLVTVHGFLTGNLFLDVNRISKYLQIQYNGGYVVSNTRTTGQRIMKTVAKHYHAMLKDRERWLAEHPGIFALFETPGRPVPESLFDDYHRNFTYTSATGPVSPARHYSVIACRADPLKESQRFADKTLNMQVFWKDFVSRQVPEGWQDKYKQAWADNPHVHFHWNAPYEQIMQTFQSAWTCLVTWPDETFGLTAFEAAQYGVRPVLFTKGEPNCTAEMLPQGEFASAIINYRDEDWYAQTVRAIGQTPHSLEARQAYADVFRSMYTRSAFISEKAEFMDRAFKRMYDLNQAREHWEFQREMSLYTFM